jgi:excisionase family DNA binding protein
MMELLDVDEVANKLKLARQTIYQYVSAKKIPYIKLGARVLFDEQAIEVWVEEHSVSSIIK